MTSRNFRVDDSIWDAAKERASREGTTLTAVIVAALTDYAGQSAPSGFYARDRSRHREAEPAQEPPEQPAQPALPDEPPQVPEITREPASGDQDWLSELDDPLADIF